MAPLKEKIAETKQNVVAFLMLFSPSNISEMIAKAKTMTPAEILMTILSGMFWCPCQKKPFFFSASLTLL
jgi:hypothetical protein